MNRLPVLDSQSSREQHAVFNLAIAKVEFNLIKGSPQLLSVDRIVGEYHKLRSLMTEYFNLPCFPQDQIAIPEVQEFENKSTWRSSRDSPGNRHPVCPFHYKKVRELGSREEGTQQVFPECCGVIAFRSLRQPHYAEVISVIPVFGILRTCLQSLHLGLQRAE